MISQCVLTPSIVAYRMQVTGNFTKHTQFEVLHDVTYVFHRSCHQLMFGKRKYANGHGSLVDASIYALGPFQSYLGGLPADNSPTIHDGRLEYLARLAQKRYGTQYTAIRGQRWWHFHDNRFGLQWATGGASLPDTPTIPRSSGTLICRARWG